MPEPPLPDAPARPLDGHKGTFGTVIVVGGCATMPGAPAICAGAALRAGAGLVKLATDSATLLAALSIEPSATGLILDGADSIDGADAKGDAVLAIGPGFGDAHDVDRLVLDLLGGNRRIVLDADGLNALARFGKPRPGGAPAVLTPHPGEFRRLAEAAGVDPDGTTPEARPANGAALARHHRAVVVLKGRQTVITDGQRTALNPTGNPALATAGSGDVLTGVIASLMAQGMPAFDAARLGCHVHGAAADAWAAEHGPAGLKARDLADRLPAALNPLRR